MGKLLFHLAHQHVVVFELGLALILRELEDRLEELGGRLPSLKCLQAEGWHK
jgi:hypothetical protein